MVVPQAFPHKKEASPNDESVDDSNVVSITSDTQHQQQQLLLAFITHMTRQQRQRRLLDMPRRRTDAPFAYLFGFFFVGWIAVVTYVLTYVDKYEAEAYPCETCVDNESASSADNTTQVLPAAQASDWYDLLQLISKDVIDFYAKLAEEFWPYILSFVFSLPISPYLNCWNFTSKITYALLALVKICLFLLFVGILVAEVNMWCVNPSTERFDFDSLGSLLYYVLAVTAFIKTSSVLIHGRCVEKMHGEITKKVRHFKLFMLLIIATIYGLVCLTVWAVQYTSLLDPLRYVLLFGSFYLYRFVVNFQNMVVAQLIATRYLSADERRFSAADSTFAYARCVIRYHLGTIALNTVGVLFCLRSFATMCRFNAKETMIRRNYFSEFFYRIYVVCNASEYTQSYVAVRGCRSSRATERVMNLLMRYCSASSIAFHHGMDSIISGQAIAAFAMWSSYVIYYFGYRLVQAAESVHATNSAIWIILGLCASFLAVTHATAFDMSFNISRTMRICLLEDKIDGKTVDEIDVKEDEYALCFDTWSNDGYHALQKLKQERASGIDSECELSEIKS